MALSKKTRFEIFKRDTFTCQYCGQRPPGVILEVDHINPKHNGGDDDLLNLITSCFDCNRGKSKRLLGKKAIRPDADIEFLACQQELAEVERFLDARAVLQQVRVKATRVIQDHWDDTLHTDGNVPAEKVIVEWLLRYSPEEVCRAIDFLLPAIRRNPFRFRNFTDYIKYTSGILRNRREASEL